MTKRYNSNVRNLYVASIKVYPSSLDIFDKIMNYKRPLEAKEFVSVIKDSYST